MLDRWKSLSFTTKFSIIAATIVAPLGLASMGLLGFGLYYATSFLFTSYPDINDWSGDWVWPATLVVGMGWSLGFVFAGLACHFLRKLTTSKVLQCIVYVSILLGWAALLWFIMISKNVEPF